jgi:hypothetical protein
MRNVSGKICRENQKEYSAFIEGPRPYLQILPIPVAVRSKAWVCGRSLTGIVGSNPPIPVAARSKAWVCGRSLAGIVGSNPDGGMDVCML